MPPAVKDLRSAGQSFWLDYIRRGLLTSGELARIIKEGWITGVTSNPTIFQRAIAGSDDYDEELRHLADHGVAGGYEAFLELGGEDIRLAADALRTVYESSDRVDGYVSFEAQEGSAAEILAEAEKMWALVGRPNLLIKVPAIPAGIEAVPSLIAAGINVNITLLFDVDVYENVARAYIAGLERRASKSLPLDGMASVASFFVSRVDTKVDELLPEDSPLRGKIAVANARAAYRRFHQIFSGRDWERLAAAGARVQRPLWASTGTKNPDYADTLYVHTLIAPHTVNTMPEPTLRAFADHGAVRPMSEADLAEAEDTLARARAAGIDLKQASAELLGEGLTSFRKDFEKLLGEIEKGLAAAPAGRERHSATLGGLAPTVDKRLETMEREAVVRRIWSIDHTVWKPDPTEITNRLGWLTVVDDMLDCEHDMRRLHDLEAFAQSVAADGYNTAVLLGMGGSSLGPQVLFETFGAASGALKLIVLDSTDPAQIKSVEGAIDLDKTLFIVASKSGTTLETLSHFAYFWEKIPDGRHFIAITDPGTKLEALAKQKGFRRTFSAPADIGGRYSVMSYFGLVPAALIGVEMERFVESAHEMQHACHHVVGAANNPGAWLGAVMGEAALAGRDKLTFVLNPAIRTFGWWVEQLIAESTGKEGRGVVPVESEPIGAPTVYGNDRLFVGIGASDGLDALEAAGHPVVRIPLAGAMGIAAEFFRWEFATAVAGHLLGSNAFDQPNVQQAKDATAAILAAGRARSEPKVEPLDAVLAKVGPGDYIALQAYLPMNAETMARVQHARMALRDRYRVATTVGFGPRYLHSTGQLHKGGANNGVFLQIVTQDSADLDIPGQPFTFGTLKSAQALGDLESLFASGRRATRVTMDQLEEGIR